jgi:hypothetical protein
MFYPDILVGKWMARATSQEIWKITGYLGGEDIQYFTVRSPEDRTEIWSFQAVRVWSLFETDSQAAEHAGSDPDAS